MSRDGMRVVHFGIWGPNQSGMYETQKELILAQRELGLDCGFIDALEPGRVQTDSDGLTSEDVRYADAADVYCLHSHIPDYPGLWQSDGTPKVCFLHGMPRYSWESEVYNLEPGNSAPCATLAGYFNMLRPDFSRYVTMWPTQYASWEIFDDYRGRVRCAPNGINLAKYTLDGPAKPLPGEPALFVCDQARMCKDPFLMVLGAEWFRAKHAPDAQLHIVGFPPQGTGNRARERWDHLIAQSGLKRVIAGVTGIVRDLPEWYRGADIVLTTISDESRVVKEAVACGCDVLGPTFSTLGIDESWLEWASVTPRSEPEDFHERPAIRPRHNRARSLEQARSEALARAETGSPFWQSINLDDTREVALTIHRIWEERSKDRDARRQLLRRFAEARYDMRRVAEFTIGVYREVLAEERDLPMMAQGTPWLDGLFAQAMAGGPPPLTMEPGTGIERTLISIGGV